MKNKFTREEIVKEAMKTYVLDEISIRSFKPINSDKQLIDQYSIHAKYLCGENYIVWGYYKIPYEPHGSVLNPASGYYPADVANIPFDIQLEKPEDDCYRFQIGKYELTMHFKLTEEVYKIKTSGYCGAATYREYYETIDEPVKYAELPIYRLEIGGVDIGKKLHGSLWSIEWKNIRVDGDTISFDYYRDYDKICSIYLSDEKKEFEVDGHIYKMK
jgi:hypothetical protein